MTGFPASDGSSSTSTDAKNASMSTCRMVGTSRRSGTEGQPAEALGVRDARPPALLRRPTTDRLAGPTSLARELASVALDGRRLRLDGVADVHPVIRLEGAGEQ